MPHVSKEKIDEKLYRQLFLNLVELQSGMNKRQITRFMRSMLTRTEQVMITKRCAAAIMFEEGYSNYRVWTTLKLSQSTAARLRKQYEEGVFDGVLDSLLSKKRKQKEREEFIAALESVLRLGMPSMGKDRWKWLR